MSHFARIWIPLFWGLVLAQLTSGAVPEGRSFSRENWSAVVELNEETLSSLPLDSELLAAAYEELFMDQIEGTEPPWYNAIRNDLERRGNSATPILLRLFAESVDGYREGLLFNLENFPTIALKPFLDAARDYWAKKKFRTRPRSCYAISRMLSRRGNASDLNILIEMKSHPIGEVSFVIEPDIVRMEKRLNGTLKPTEWTGRPPDGYQWVADSNTTTPPLNQQSPSSTPWSIIVVLIVATGGLLWLLLKRRSNA